MFFSRSTVNWNSNSRPSVFWGLGITLLGTYFLRNCGKYLSKVTAKLPRDFKPSGTSASNSTLASTASLHQPSINCLPWSRWEVSNVLWMTRMRVLWIWRMRAHDYIWTSFSNSMKAITLIKGTSGERGAKFTFLLLRNIKACARAKVLTNANHISSPVQIKVFV
jgi:hypothetical protein